MNSLEPKMGFVGRIKGMKRKTRNTIVVLLIIAIVICILAMFCPSHQAMHDSIPSDFIKEAEKTKKYSETYYNYGFANVIVGKQVKTGEAYTFVGCVGTITRADDGFMSFIADVMIWIPALIDGAKITISLTIVSVVCGLIISLFFALGKMSKRKIINKICGAYIFFFRGTPLLMQLYFIYYGLPLLSPSLAINIQFIAAFIAFTLNSAAYCAEIIRAALQSIDKGQFEASRALGMSYSQTMRHVIVPQSFRRLIPPVGNEFIMVLKDASLVSIIALSDLTHVTRTIATANASPLVYLPAMVIYLIITAFFTYIFNRAEKKFSVYE